MKNIERTKSERVLELVHMAKRVLERRKTRVVEKLEPISEEIMRREMEERGMVQFGGNFGWVDSRSSLDNF